MYRSLYVLPTIELDDPLGKFLTTCGITSSRRWGGYTTVEDLLRFANALTQHKLLNEHYTDLLTTTKPETGDAHYAYGFEDNVVRGVRSFGHSGGAPGMNGDLLIFPQTGYVVVALANMDRGAQREASWISERLPAQ
ncbi:MAG: serine hydrolase [Gemmatimonadaceae bacterium]